jgi:TetR/AcrR family transcriptional regulator, transcriptional repressor for nem operon
MARTEPDKRTRLIETATKLAYRRGFRETSLADIAEAANAPVGNVYYYFKTKDELGEAFVEERLAEFRALRDQINRLGSPKERLLAFVDGIQRRKDQLARAGCPLGALCSEVHKEGAALAKHSAALFTEPMGWLEGSSGPPAMKRTHANSRCTSSPPIKVLQRWRSARTTPTSW